MTNILQTIYKKDPALKGVSALEILFYQGLHALIFYRIAHSLYRANIPIIPRLISQIARFLTGIEIHPGAKIGKNVFIDHGMGVIIGETAQIGNNVMMYDNVLLGAKGWWLNNKGQKRHPTIGNNVTLCSGCKILGPIKIGDNCIIGAGAIVNKDVLEDTTVIQKRELIFKKQKKAKYFI